MYRVRPGKFYCLTRADEIVWFEGPLRRQLFTRRFLTMRPVYGDTYALGIALRLGGRRVPQADAANALARMAACDRLASARIARLAQSHKALARRATA